MWAENNLVGKGARFCFSVPIAPRKVRTRIHKDKIILN
jgi:hypothetical protein